MIHCPGCGEKIDCSDFPLRSLYGEPFGPKWGASYFCVSCDSMLEIHVKPDISRRGFDMNVVFFLRGEE